MEFHFRLETYCKWAVLGVQLIAGNKRGYDCLTDNQCLPLAFLTVFWLCMGCRRPLEGVQEKFGALETLNLRTPPAGHRKTQKKQAA